MEDIVFITRLRSNLKSPTGEPWEVNLGRLTYVFGVNRGNKSAVLEALSLALTGAIDLPRKPEARDGTRLISLAPADDGSKKRHLFAEAYIGDELVASYHLHQDGKGAVQAAEHTIHRPDLIDPEWALPLRRAKAIVDSNPATARRATLALADRIMAAAVDDEINKVTTASLAVARQILPVRDRNAFDDVIASDELSTMKFDTMTAGDILAEVEQAAARISRGIKPNGDISKIEARIATAAGLLGPHTKAAAAVTAIDADIEAMQVNLDAAIADVARQEAQARADAQAAAAEARIAQTEIRASQAEAETVAVKTRVESMATARKAGQQKAIDEANSELATAVKDVSEAKMGIAAWTAERDRRLAAAGGMPLEIIEAHRLVITVARGHHEHSDSVLKALGRKAGTCTACGVDDSDKFLEDTAAYYDGVAEMMASVREAIDNINDFKMDLNEAQTALAVAKAKIKTLEG